MSIPFVCKYIAVWRFLFAFLPKDKQIKENHLLKIGFSVNSFQSCLMYLRAYPVLLYSTSVYTVDDVDKCESLWKVCFYHVIHDGGITNP